MARASDAQLLRDILARSEPGIRRAFLDAIADLRDGVVLRVVVDNLERGDINGAVAALNLDADAFGRFEAVMLEAYNAGGQAFVGNLPRLRDPQGNRIIFRWGVRNLPAEQELRRHSADLVNGIVQEQRDGIREVLTEGLARGDNPWVSARKVTGRINRATGRREGGIIGLTGQQMEWMQNAEAELASGDPAVMRRYLGRKMRDRRFDRTVANAIREERPLAPADVRRMVERYNDRMLAYRGKVLARNETMISLAKARDDAFRQQIESGKIDAADITKEWRYTPRPNNRDQHIAMSGTKVGWDQAFIAPDGSTIRYPHDPEAPVHHTIGCFCRVIYSIDFAGAAARRYRERVGG